ncbi:hypothetical protein [Ramlibacter humi]|uniref:Uncharacterized protein n=1 Tax=Ramlibacter humi TaxID=2530451 RepID=A0A4Z0BZ74_9BURK|nr:hypothetical protein [Ramlibacter humi]TFZ03844.1 hypothetical protein EZ216_09340 [Ramlibacter humi]
MGTLGFVDTLPSQPGKDSLEEVLGPICGYYLACYSVESLEGFYGYAKVCGQRPESVWGASAQAKVVAGPLGSPEAAITAVVDAATLKLARRIEERETLLYSWRSTEPGAASA